MKQLVLGGARSGKSTYAQQLAIDSGKTVIYIATAFAGDEEMAQRIKRHQQQRPPEWQVVEERIALAETLKQLASDTTCLLVDCLTLWLTNLLCCNEGGGDKVCGDEEGRDKGCSENTRLLQQQRDALLDGFKDLPGDIILVSNDVGMGIIPSGALNRQFVDEAGLLHQALAKQCDRVFLTVAGLPLTLK